MLSVQRCIRVRHNLMKGIVSTLLYTYSNFGMRLVLFTAFMLLPYVAHSNLGSTTLENIALRVVNCSESFDLADSDNQTCGFLIVPEDYSKPEGNRIEVPYVIVDPTDYIDPELGPLLITGGGGPGNAFLKPYSVYGMDDSSYVSFPLMSTSEGRQLIILENRGVGKSIPNLNCQELEDEAVNIYKLPTGHWHEGYLASLKACVARLSNKNINLNHYNVLNSARDIYALRMALVHAEVIPENPVNMYGISYGSRVALYTEMLFPDVIRSMILDSVSIQELHPSMEEHKNFRQSLDELFRECREDKHCNKAYGNDLEADYYDFLQALYEEPEEIDVLNPKTLKPEKLILDNYGLSYIVALNLYSLEGRNNLPFLLRTAMNGSMTALSGAFTEMLHGEMKNSLDEIAFYSYLCFDSSYENGGFPELSESDLEQYPTLKYSSDEDLKFMTNVCGLLDIDAEKGYLTRNDIIEAPVLLLSGELDPVTPPRNAKFVADRATNAWKIDWPNISHDVLSHSYCAEYIAQEFLLNPYQEPAEPSDLCDSPIPDIEFKIY